MCVAMKLFSKSNPFKKLTEIFGAYVRGDEPDPATSPQGIVPAEFTAPPTDPLAETKKSFFRAVRQEDIFRAIRLEDMSILSSIVAGHPEAVSWEEPDTPYAQTGLLVAAKHNCPKAAEFLCANGADVSAKDKTGCNALITAAGTHNVELVKVLLAHRSPVDAESDLGETALLGAVKYLQRLQMLAEKQLDLAPKKIDYETIRILIEAGADPAQKNKYGENAYTIAETLHDKEVFLSVLGANQTRIDNADIQAGKKPVIRVMKPLRFKQ